MEDDTLLTLSEIHNGDPSALIHQILDIQKHTTSREVSQSWAKNLRFLDISGVSIQDELSRKKRYRATRIDGISQLNDNPKSSYILPLTERLDIEEKILYMAISWRWDDQIHTHKTTNTRKYQVQRPREQPCNSRVPDIYLDRAIRCAQAHEINLLWVDKECIYQENAEDQYVGIQAMDLVYRESEISLGLLTKEILLQDQLDHLYDLFSARVFNKGSKEPMFKSTASSRLISGILGVLRLILSDDRWERTWIFQEDHCASSKMYLLISHAPNLWKKGNRFGDMSGELLISCAEFRKVTTRFCMAYQAAGNARLDDILSRVKQYNIWNKFGLSKQNSSPSESQLSRILADNDETSSFPASSLSILEDIRIRKNQVVGDKLAIFANCCQYATRLDIAYLTREGYDLSTCILCLYLLNGEILGNFIENLSSQPLKSSEDLLDCSVYDFLHRISFTFSPPMDFYQVSFIDNHCRFSEVKLKPNGVETSGWLWKIGETISFDQDRDDFSEKSLESESSSSNADDWELHVLLRELKHLNQHSLVNQIYRHLDRDIGQDWPSKYFIDLMMAAILKGLREGKNLSLAYLNEESEALGIFVGLPNDDIPREPRMVFTSFSNKDDKFVSIEVYHDGSTDNQKNLYAKSWINGIWFAYGKRRQNCLFRWPFKYGTTSNQLRD